MSSNFLCVFKAIFQFWGISSELFFKQILCHQIFGIFHYFFYRSFTTQVWPLNEARQICSDLRQICWGSVRTPDPHLFWWIGPDSGSIPFLGGSVRSPDPYLSWWIRPNSGSIPFLVDPDPIHPRKMYTNFIYKSIISL